MIKLIGLALLAAAITYLSVPALLWVYLTASGFQDVQASPLVGLLVIPLVTILIGMWGLVIGNYRQANKEKQ